MADPPGVIPGAAVPAVTGGLRYRRLSPLWRTLFGTSAILVVALALNQLLNLQLFVGIVLTDSRYLYVLLALLVPFAFVMFPAGRRAPGDRVPWYDVTLAGLTLFCFVSLAWVAERMELEAWEFTAPREAVWLCLLLWALLLEAVRRAGGWALFMVIGTVSLYPLFAGAMPAPFTGITIAAPTTATYHMIGSEGLLGIPMRVFAGLVLGFLLFGAVLQHTGAGKFFMDFAFALLGHVRGGPAKVAIFSSGMLGSLSGSVTTNVLTTGMLTIPAMKRIGFSPRYAAGVEACASTGGVLMPPIMGATAFIIAAFLGIPYLDVALAALIPSVLYFFGLFVAIDAYSARRGLKGIPVDELPLVMTAIKEGWQYIFAFAFLVYMLAVAQQEALAPYYAAGALIVTNQALRRTRWGWRDFLRFLDGAARLFAELGTILAAIGLVVGALTMTGMAATFTNDLIHIAGNNPYVLLVMGAATCFVLGIGLTVTAAYIFLAVVLAPGLVAFGFDPLAVHLFLLYWGMLSFITPPVAVGAFAAATIAEADSMATGFEAMRLGAIIYFIPFFFVLNPALIFHGPWQEVILVTCTAFLGVLLISAGLQGWLAGIGRLTRHWLGWPARALLVVGGFLFALPGGGETELSHAELVMLAVALSGLGAVLGLLINRAPALAR